MDSYNYYCVRHIIFEHKQKILFKSLSNSKKQRLFEHLNTDCELLLFNNNTFTYNIVFVSKTFTVYAFVLIIYLHNAYKNNNDYNA